jgi:taurine dioxygenase
MSLAFEVHPLSPCIGAEVRGIDVAGDVDEPTFDQIRRAWFDHSVLLFRGQDLSEPAQVRFGERFGELARVQVDYGYSEHPSVMYITNVKKDGKLVGALPDGEMLFHSDLCYVERPSAATILYAIEVPSRGGNTLFASAYAAYETLPEEWKHRLEGLRAMHVYAPGYTDNRTARMLMKTASEPGARAFAHPLVRTHPVTRRRALFVNRLMTACVVDVPPAESDEILLYLFAHQEQPRFVYEHVWTPGDLLIWDNRCTLHARTDFSAAERRMLRRVAILGEKPE